MYYLGGHLKTQDGNVELGSTDSGTLKGFRQWKNGIIQIRGDRVDVDAKGGVYFDGAVNMVDLNVQTILTMKVGSKLLLKTPNITLPGPIGHSLPGPTINVLETITDLKNTIKELQNRIAALEAK